MDADRFALEVRTVLVSWRAAVASAIPDDGNGVDRLNKRAAVLLTELSGRYPGLANDETSNTLLSEAVKEIASPRARR